MKKTLAAFLLAASVATPAVAGDGPFYVGAEVGKDDYFGVLGGYKINDMFAVEINYNVYDDEKIDMGWVKTTVEAWSAGVHGVFNFPIQPVPGLSVFGKAGLERVEVETTFVDTWFDTVWRTKSDDIEFAGSVGAQYDVTANFSARAGVHIKGQADSVFANAIYSF